MTATPQKIGIVGLGQIGGSIGLALRKRAPEIQLVGVDVQKKRTEAAGLFLDAVSTNLNVLTGVDWIILAVPVEAILHLMETISVRFPQVYVLDTGSTKREIVRKARALAPGFHFVGGHPLAGTEKAGEDGWNADLFQGRTFFLAQVSDDKALNGAAEQLVSLIGAQPRWVEPETHDRLLGFSSHFAYLLSALYLFQGASGQKLDRNFLGSGFASMARLAGSSAEMGIDMVWTNRDHVLQEIQEFQRTLKKLEKILEEGRREELNDWLRRSESLWQEVKSCD